MKVISILLLTCVLGAGQLLFGQQEPIYRWGPPATNNDIDHEIDQLLTLDDEGFVLLRSFTEPTFVKNYWLEYYDPSLKLVGKERVNFNTGVMGDSKFIEDIIVNNGQIIAFVSNWNKSKGAHTLSLHSLSLAGEMAKIADLDVITAKKMGNKGIFNYSFSDDGSKLLVLSEQPFIKKTNEKLKMTCFDMKSMQELWSHEQELSVPSKRGVNNEIVVDNQGRAYMFKTMVEKMAYTYAMFTFDGKSNWTDYMSLGVSEEEIQDFKMTFNAKNEMVFYGIFGKKSASSSKTSGSLFIQFDANQVMGTNSLKMWDSEIVAYFEGDRVAGKEDKAYIQNLYIKDILYRTDGKMLVLMEQLKEDKSPIAGSQPIQYTYQYNYGDFLSLCLDPSSGELDWWQAFNKAQEVTYPMDQDVYGSYVYFLKEDRLFVFWNNTRLSVPSIPAANWKEPDGTKYIKNKAFHDKTMHGTFMYVIEPDGYLTYGDRTFGLPLFNFHEGAVFEMSLTTPFFFELNGDLVVMSSMHNGGKRYRFGFIGL